MEFSFETLVATINSVVTIFILWVGINRICERVLVKTKAIDRLATWLEGKMDDSVYGKDREK